MAQRCSCLLALLVVWPDAALGSRSGLVDGIREPSPGSADSGALIHGASGDGRRMDAASAFTDGKPAGADPTPASAGQPGESPSPEVDPKLIEPARQAERRRVEVLSRAGKTVVCIFGEDRQGGGSGVVIDAAGYGLTNFHVVAGMMETRRGLGGMSDGQLYELDVLGVDPTGDVAMFRLSGKDSFDFAPLGDSDQVKVGDSVMAMGNPFILAEDYQATATLGIVSGVHRYQKGQNNELVYSDCIQTDAPINPGNSGGPLFNEQGEVIGINGRISVNTRGRFNVGLGYAISMNQIKRFIPSLRAGLQCYHGTLDATVFTQRSGEVVFDQIVEDGPAWNIGVRPGDVLLEFDTVPIRSANHFASLLGAYPENWPALIVFQRGSAGTTVQSQMVRLARLGGQRGKRFEPNAEANQRQVKRVLEEYRRAVVPIDAEPSARAGTTAPIERISAKVEVTALDELGAARGQPATVEVVECATEMSSWRQLPGPDQPGRTLEFDRQGAWQVTGGERISVTEFERILRESQWFLRWRLASPDFDASAWRDEGGDALLTPRDAAAARSGELMEVLSGEIMENVTARIGFLVESGRPGRMEIRTAAMTGTTDNPIVVEYGDWRAAAGRNRPHRIRILDPRNGQLSQSMIEEWSDISEGAP